MFIEDHVRAARETGWIVCEEVEAAVLCFSLDAPNGPGEVECRGGRVHRSRERRCPGDPGWEIVVGHRLGLGSGYGFSGCGAQQVHCAHGADEFLPSSCCPEFGTYLECDRLELPPGHDPVRRPTDV